MPIESTAMINRREFARLSSLAAVTAASTSITTAAPRTAASSKKALLKPKKLSAGDTVGMVAPATAPFERDEIAYAKEQLEAIGFKVELGKHVYDRWGYFAGRDRDRAEDINSMFADDRIAGIICFTGGWGSPRVLPYLDYDLIAKKPKVLVGYSDITALLNPIHQRTGLVTFHGPVGESVYDQYTLENFRRVIMTAEPAGLQPTPAKRPNMLVDKTNRIVRITGGKASGPLVGGNLTMIASLMGTPYELDTAGAIVFLEDIHEDLYRIDRMLTQLALGGKFEGIAGFVWGRCTDCKYSGPSLSLGEILGDRFAASGVPAISGLSFGHIEQKLVMPIGVRATLDADAGTLSFDEAAVA